MQQSNSNNSNNNNLQPKASKKTRFNNENAAQILSSLKTKPVLHSTTTTTTAPPPAPYSQMTTLTTTSPQMVTSTTESTSLIPSDFYKRPFTPAIINNIKSTHAQYITVGRGTYGSALYFTYRGRALIRKVIDIRNPWHYASFNNEVRMLTLLRSEGKYFPYLYASVISYDPQNRPFRGHIIMEYISGYPLAALLRTVRSDTRGLLSFEIEALIYQIKDALNVLHNEYRLLHLDLKPGNIMVRFHQNVILGIIIIDFGFTKQLPQGSNTIENEPYPGTLRYASPTLLSSSHQFLTERATSPQSTSPTRYHYSAANNAHSANIVYDEMRSSLETNVDTKPKIGKFNKDCTPRYDEDNIEDSLMYAACVFANQGTFAGLNCALRILTLTGYNLHVNSQDSVGDTLLHSVLYNIDYDYAVVDHLITMGAHSDIENNRNTTPIDVVDNHIEDIQGEIDDLTGRTDQQSRTTRQTFTNLLKKLKNTKSLLQNTSTSLSTTTTTTSSGRRKQNNEYENNENNI